MGRSHVLRLSVMIAAAIILIPSCKTDRVRQQEASGTGEGDDRTAGFDRETATLHFYLLPEGGIMTAEANDPADTVNRDRIRLHLQRAMRLFAEGDFHASELVHGEMPPGAPIMQRLRSEISYQYKESVSGGEITIITNNRQAQRAVQQFLRYQIRQYQTGDPTEVRRL